MNRYLLDRQQRIRLDDRHRSGLHGFAGQRLDPAEQEANRSNRRCPFSADWRETDSTPGRLSHQLSERALSAVGHRILPSTPRK
jgi:hypothetical protein